jgi:hypothetical protein
MRLRRPKKKRGYMSDEYYCPECYLTLLVHFRRWNPDPKPLLKPDVCPRCGLPLSWKSFRV